MRGAYRILALFPALFLGGCPLFVAGVATPGIIHQDRVNLLNASYAAVDTLSTQTTKTFDLSTPLVIQKLVEIPDMAQKPVKMNPKVGDVLADQYRERFAQLGYNVVNIGHYPTGTFGEVSGSYEIKDGTMTIALRMTERKTGKLIGTYDYALPVTYDIKKYMTYNANSLPPLPPIFSD